MVVSTLSHRGACPFPPCTHLNYSFLILQRLYLCFTLVLGGSTHYLELYWLVKALCLGQSWWFSPCHIVVRAPSLHGPTSISLLCLYKGYICVLHWCWVVAPITWDFVGWWKPCALASHGGQGTLSHRGACPFPPWTHLNCSVMIIQRLYLCSALVLGGSIHYLELYWLVKTLCLGQSWWFSPCHVVLCTPSLHGPTSIPLFWLYKGYICVLHWCWVVASITWNFIGWWKSCAWASHGGFHPVTSWCVPLPSMDPPQFLCYVYTKAIFVFYIGVGW